jgi:hypothetical protein
VKKLPNKTLLLVSIFFLFIILATAPLVTVKAAPTCIVSVVFGNGLSSITLDQDTDFNVSVTITDSPAIDFFSINITWDPAVITLKHNDTTLDVLNGGFMPTFTGPSFSLTHLDTGNLGDVCGLNTVGYNSGNGTLFKMLMHSIAPSVSNITIESPNVSSYLMHTDIQVNIDVTNNGTMEILIPEFSVSMLLTVFMVTTTLVIAAAIVSSRKRRVLPRI